jgi:uncharacterized protein YxjI
MKSKFGAGRDFEVTGLDGARAFYVDGKVAARPKAEVRDAQDQVVYVVTGKLMGIPKKMSITRPDGTEVAHLSAKMFSPIKDRMTLAVADGEDWSLVGSFIEKNYSVTANDRPIVQITQKWVAIRDQYTVDVADGTDAGLAFAIVWAVDRWVERD